MLKGQGQHKNMYYKQLIHEKGLREETNEHTSLMPKK